MLFFFGFAHAILIVLIKKIKRIGSTKAPTPVNPYTIEASGLSVVIHVVLGCLVVVNSFFDPIFSQNIVNEKIIK